jgi:anti-sigma regulatory factor (Ser/Thr protein kinase)
MIETELIIANDIRELETINRFLEKYGEQWELSPKTLFSLNLVLEELIANIILYGYEDDSSHEITIGLQLEGDIITLIITDDGKSFDPFQVDTPADLDKPAEDRKIGGLGIHFVREIMDSFAYQRVENKNQVILSKKVK